MSAEVVSPSARDELISVVRAAMAIAAATGMYLANHPFPGGSIVQRSLLPFQRTVATLAPAEQRIFRELQVSLIEAETLRSMEGAWPEAERLAAEGIEPFAINPTAKDWGYSWKLIRNGLLVNYLGVPKRPGAAAWLIMVLEPDPALPPEVFVEDEEHDRLLDGSVLHVSIWNHPEGERVGARAVSAPQSEGWLQVYAADPSVKTALQD
jgi:hypothetical protein